MHDHRSDVEEISYARSRIAEAEYKQINDSFILPAVEERDQEATADAYKELKSFLHDYPEAKESHHICDLLDDVTIRLVRHEMYVARFYLNKNNFDAAVFRLQYALRNYVSDVKCARSPSRLPPGIPERPQEAVKDTEFGLVPAALLLLGETFLKMHRYTDARTAFDALLGPCERVAVRGIAAAADDDIPVIACAFRVDGKDHCLRAKFAREF